MQPTAIQATSSNITQGNTAHIKDLRDTSRWKDLYAHFQKLHGPAFGKISNAQDAELSPGGGKVSFTGSTWNKLEGVPDMRICVAELASGKLEVITNGPNNDQCGKWSPDGKSLAFISDRITRGSFHPYLLSMGDVREARRVDIGPRDSAEYISWSPDGKYILVATAGHGADKAGGQGSGTLGNIDSGEAPAWMPSIEPNSLISTWRKLSVYDVAEESLRRITPAGVNVWEATWCGSSQIAAIVSDDPGEGSWYKSTLSILDVDKESCETIFVSPRQIGLPAPSPSGSQVALVEGLFSDRGVVCGQPKLIDLKRRTPTTLKTNGVDVSQMFWITDDSLFFVGLRGIHAVTGRIDTKTLSVTEIWQTEDGLGRRYPTTSNVVDNSFAVIREQWTQPPEVSLVSIESGSCKTVQSLGHEGGAYLRSVVGPMESLTWKAPDGQEIQGFLCLPKIVAKPYPLVLNVHGGPIWAFTNTFQLRSPWVALMVKQGYAVLNVNCRGSKGRGEDFAAQVHKDMGGADVDDFLSGIDYLVKQGIVDEKRLGVTGGSYGGFMSAWIITQTKRFAASVPFAPVTDWFFQHTTANIPYFDHLMMEEDPYLPQGIYHDRSAIRFVKNVVTPTLQLVGSDDRCTPPGQALQFHNALLEHGVDSVLVTYPGEGHGVYKYPAVIDFCQRMLEWFNKYMPA